MRYVSGLSGPSPWFLVVVPCRGAADLSTPGLRPRPAHEGNSGLPRSQPSGCAILSSDLSAQFVVVDVTLASSAPTDTPAQHVKPRVQHIYFGAMRELEEHYQFHRFYGPLLSAADLDAKPSVVLLGQYSTGKTTFIRHLLGRPYPGANIGPEPTTDRFTVVLHGTQDRQVRRTQRSDGRARGEALLSLDSGALRARIL